MTFENAAKGRPAVSSTTLGDPTAIVDDIIDRLRDSQAGLHKAADLIDDRALTKYISGIVERRKETLDSLVVKAEDDGMDLSTESTGTITEALRRRWMRLEASVTGDDAVVETAVDAEQDLLDRIDEALRAELPKAIARVLRATADDIESDLGRLSAWNASSNAEETS